MMVPHALRTRTVLRACRCSRVAARALVLRPHGCVGKSAKSIYIYLYRLCRFLKSLYSSLEVHIMDMVQLSATLDSKKCYS